MRELIERRLAARPADADPKRRLLANVVGAVSSELLELVNAPSQQAAVLIALIERSRGLTVLFTERAPHLKRHPGQISFPGGRLDHSDETIVAAALREAEEEVGLGRASVTVAGCLGPHVTGTGFKVTPVIGFVAGDFEPVPDPTEVQTVFEVPLKFLLDPDNVCESLKVRFGTRFRSFEYVYEGHRIWGATAAMLMSFRDVIND